MPGHRYNELATIAYDQHGYVGVDDARALGMDPGYLRVLARRNVLDHVGRGIFRLPLIPRGPLDEYMQAVLWPQDVRGVLCNETALDLYDVCDINPARIHIAVPAAHRIQRDIPAHYEIHRADLDPRDIQRWQALPMVMVRRAIEECIDSGVRSGLIEQAIETARDQARLRRDDAQALRERLAQRGAA